MGKGRKDRLVPVGKVALYYLDLYLEQRGLKLSGPLFYNLRSGKPLTVVEVREIVRRRAASAHLKKKCHPRFVPPQLRASFGRKRRIDSPHSGKDGTRKAHTTQKYTRILPAELKRIHAKAHPAERRTKQDFAESRSEVESFFFEPFVL